MRPSKIHHLTLKTAHSSFARVELQLNLTQPSFIKFTSSCSPHYDATPIRYSLHASGKYEISQERVYLNFKKSNSTWFGQRHIHPYIPLQCHGHQKCAGGHWKTICLHDSLINKICRIQPDLTKSIFIIAPHNTITNAKIQQHWKHSSFTPLHFYDWIPEPIWRTPCSPMHHITKCISIRFSLTS